MIALKALGLAVVGVTLAVVSGLCTYDESTEAVARAVKALASLLGI